MNWCIENTDQCIWMSGFMERMNSGENTMELLGKVFDLVELFMSDDTCASDMEQIHSAARLMEDVGLILRDIYGYEGHFDANKEVKQMSVFHFIRVIAKIFMHDLNMEVKAIAASIPEPDFFGMLPEWTHHGRHHGHKRHHQSQESPFGWFKCPFSGQAMSLPKIELRCPFTGKPLFPMFEQQSSASAGLDFNNFHLF